MKAFAGKFNMFGLCILTCTYMTCFLSQSALAADDLSTVVRFETAFRRANSRRDIHQLEQLVFWNRATETSKRALRHRLREGLGRTIDRIQVLPFSGETALFGAFLRHPTLRPSHIFVVWYMLPRDNVGVPIVGTRYPIGMKDGTFYIIPADGAPVSSIHY